MLNIDDLDPFTRAYMECALWSTNDESTPSGGEPMDTNYSITDIADETVVVMRADCDKFQAENAEDIRGEESQAGHDFWLTRGGHGCGFWEVPDWPEEAGKRLTAAAKAFGEFDLYVGDDGKIYHG